MRQALQISLLQFRLTLKSKSVVFMMFGLPLLFTLIFGSLATGETAQGPRSFPIAVVDSDDSFIAHKLVEALQQEKLVRVTLMTTVQMNKAFSDKQIDSAVVIPTGFQQGVADGSAPELQLVASPDGNRNAGLAPAIQRAVARVAGDYRLARQMAGSGAPDSKVADSYAKVVADRQALAVTVERTQVTRPETGNAKQSNVGQVAMGFTVTFLMMTIFMKGGAILQERQNGTWGRVLTTPASKVAIVGGYLFSFFLVGMFQFIVLVVAGSLLFQITWGPLPQLLVMGAALVLCSAGMGLFLAGVVRTHEQQATIGAVFVTATSMLGGVYWPLEMMSKTMQRIGHLTPQAWAIEGLREVMLRGGAWGSLTWPLVVLLSITVIFLGAGLLRVRYE